MYVCMYVCIVHPTILSCWCLVNVELTNFGNWGEPERAPHLSYCCAKSSLYTTRIRTPAPQPQSSEADSAGCSSSFASFELFPRTVYVPSVRPASDLAL